MAKQKKRNPYVALALQLKGGPHQKSNKAIRQKDKQSIKRSADKAWTTNSDNP